MTIDANIIATNIVMSMNSAAATATTTSGVSPCSSYRPRYSALMDHGPAARDLATGWPQTCSGSRPG
jgi:hypothetical protein